MHKTRTTAGLTLAIASVLAIATPASAGPRTWPQPHGYTVVTLGWLGGLVGRATAINDRGHVVGTGLTADDSTHPFLWRNGIMTDLGVLPGADYDCEATDVNNLDEVVGICSVHDDNKFQAFRWRRGVMTDLGSLGGSSTIARAINDHGQIVGTGTDSANVTHAFLWQHATMTDLGPGTAMDINNRGVVVGTDAQTHAFSWYRGRSTDLGVAPGSALSMPWSINEHGTIVGLGEDMQLQPFAFVWRDGQMGRLPSLGGALSHALAVNNREQILGWAQAADESFHNVMWWGDAIIDLAPLGILSSYDVDDINGHGMIAGTYHIDSGRTVPVLFVPVP